MTDDQPTQPLTDAELETIRTRFDNRNGDMRSWGPVTLFHAAREVPRLLAEVDRLRAELSGVRTALINAHEAGMSLGQEVERLNLEVVQVQSGAQIAMNAGVAALQEVKRLEGVVAGLKEINDRMAEDRLRIIDERDGFRKMMNSTVSAGVTIDGERLDALREVERLQGIVEAQRVALSSRGAPVPECPDEWCLGWKDSGICPAGLKHW